MVLHFHAGKRRESPPAPLRAGDETTAVLEYASARRHLTCDLEHPALGALALGEPDANVDADGPLFLFLRGEGIVSAQGMGAEIRIADLTLEAGPEAVTAAPFEPKSAVDHLFVANGLWMRGRREGAMDAYDRAVEAAGESTRPASGDDNIPDVAVDARFWRALLRARLEGPSPAARADLAEAQALDAGRVTALIEKSALPLAGRDEEVALLAAHLRAVHGPEPFKMLPFVKMLFRVHSLEVLRTCGRGPIPPGRTTRRAR
jgi:hypothetical protein